MKTSESIKEIATALVKAQASTKAVIKDANNPFFKSKYADLASVIEVVKSPLNENGITVLQPVDGDVVRTRLVHVSGEWIEDDGVKIVCKEINNPQAQGSAITYSRRYGLMSLLSIPAEDDDGESATDHKAPVQAPTQSPAPKTAPSGKCPECHAVGNYHAPNCTMKVA